MQNQHTPPLITDLYDNIITIKNLPEAIAQAEANLATFPENRSYDQEMAYGDQVSYWSYMLEQLRNLDSRV
ncbi:hypothetical protein [Mucilaginibacter paludis]|uniref:Uncharacterized protein n=1 Tax=Mucilaginibacter paludis DSM 18603 TaxID=714943 RepID=H1YBW8_9SPHI|nr:hypothetical protein [Mucilaginibacter paludis]EHQ27046.1 hypothetical protein Mucpa_2938 [Mucilaginibacter paludis DSM 18603]